MKIYNPGTEELITELTEDNHTSLQKKFTQAKQDQFLWSKKSMQERVKILENFMQLLDENMDKLMLDLNKETGKLLHEARNEITGACYRIQFFLNHAESTLQDKMLNEINGVREILSFDPLGVIANISAWNYPFLVGVNVFIPALLAGNAVLYKPSEYATLTGLNIANLLHKAGVPETVFSVVIGTGKVGEMLLHLPLNGYFFTGSYKTGKFIAESTAQKLVPVGLELGGKDPVYVMEDVTDMTKVAAGLVDGAFYNNGQSCCAVERIYVHETIYTDFVSAYLKETQKLTNVAPLTRPQQIDILEKQIEDALNKGANILCGGKRKLGKGYFFEPTVLINVNHSMLVMKEESFGPVIGIQSVSSDTEALSFMQDTEYGLTAGIYGKNEERARTLLAQIEVGTGYFNCCDRVSPFLPWSGRRHSGLGATLSYLGILAFAKPKAYMLAMG